MPRRLLPIALVAVAACAGDPLPPPPPPAPPAPTAAQAPAPPAPALRLPKGAEPVRYRAALTLVPSAPGFDGEVEIDLKLAQATPFLWLNGSAITVKDARVEASGKTIAARAVPGGDDFLGFAFAEPVPAGAATLHVTYHASISDKDDRGVFREQVDGASYLFSQFESVEARRAFPCFDEPSFKTPWQVTLRVNEGDSALSNTPALSTTREGGMKVVRFAETKPLPSYLVAFAVGPFDIVDAGKAGKKGTPLRLVTPKGRGARAAYALKSTPVLLGKLEDYFDIAYPYEKLDVVAIPHLASFGAMENPGLITFHESGMLARPEDETVAFKQGYVATIAHEMGHQWFGDLVTMAWWDDIWLNEAFASWIEDKMTSAFEPAWHWELSRARSTSWAMRGDALVSARRIRQTIESRDDIQNAFDEITYSKGAAVISMFESFAGPDRFRRGVHDYLEAHAHGNATAADFLAAVSAAGSPAIGRAFSTFLDQPGVPLVRAELACKPGQKGEVKVKLAQRRYLPSGSAGKGDERWEIPVCVRWGAGKAEGRSCTMLADREATVPVEGAKVCPDWALLNAGDAGYYHGGYGAKALAALLGKGWPHLGPAERAGVIRDMGALVQSGDLPAGDMLARVADLAKDPSNDVLEGALNLAGAVRRPMLTPELEASYARYLQKTFGARARALGWTPKAGEDDRVRLLRPHLLAAVADRGADPALAAEAADLAGRWLDKPASVPADIADAVLGTAAANGDRKLFDRLRAAAKKATDDQSQRRIVRAMASFRDPALSRAALDLTLTDELDPRVAVGLLWQPDRSAPVVFDFLKANFDALVARLPGEVRGEVPFLLSGFCDDARAAEVEAFLKDRAKVLTGATRNARKAVERIRLCAANRRDYQASLAKFLAKY